MQIDSTTLLVAGLVILAGAVYLLVGTPVKSQSQPAAKAPKAKKENCNGAASAAKSNTLQRQRLPWLLRLQRRPRTRRSRQWQAAVRRSGRRRAAEEEIRGLVLSPLR